MNYALSPTDVLGDVTPKVHAPGGPAPCKCPQDLRPFSGRNHRGVGWLVGLRFFRSGRVLVVLRLNNFGLLFFGLVFESWDKLVQVGLLLHGWFVDIHFFGIVAYWDFNISLIFIYVSIFVDR